jgi:hypothetical protein
MEESRTRLKSVGMPNRLGQVTNVDPVDIANPDWDTIDICGLSFAQRKKFRDVQCPLTCQSVGLLRCPSTATEGGN